MSSKREVLIDVAYHGYKINVVLLASGGDWSPRFNKGPRHAGFSFKRDTLYIAPMSPPSDIFHEMCHLVLGPPSVVLSEGYVLLPFEWELAKHVSTLMDKKDRQPFLNGIRNYQDCTEIGRWGMGLDELGRVRSQKWWKRGVERAKRLNLLRDNGIPTFQRARWEGSGVPSRAPRWDPMDDYKFPGIV